MPSTKTLLITIVALICNNRSDAFSPSPLFSTSTDVVRPQRTIVLSPINQARRINTSNVCLHSTTENDLDSDKTKADKARLIAIAQKKYMPANTFSTSSSRDESTSSQKQNSNNKNDEEWKFFDTARLHVTGGDGGNGCVAFRREKGEAMGGPNGGRGGAGGSVFFIADESLNTLAGLRSKIHVKAAHGKNGIGKNKDGSFGNDNVVRVPCGTIVRELHT